MFNQVFSPSLFVFISAAISGFIFGFLLRKAHLSRFDIIIKQLILKDFTVMKVIFTAIIVGSIGFYFMHSLNIVKFQIIPATVYAGIIGGAIFGVGMAILGYCPGTAVAAIADGSRHAIYGVLGMFTGAYIFGEVQKPISKYITLMDPLNKITLQNYFNISPWVIISILIIFATTFFYILDTKILKKK